MKMNGRLYLQSLILVGAFQMPSKKQKSTGETVNTYSGESSTFLIFVEKMNDNRNAECKRNSTSRKMALNRI